MNTLIVNIEPSPLRNRKYRIFLLDGTHYDVGLKKFKYYVDHHDTKMRYLYYVLLTNEVKEKIISLKPSHVL
jgi:hypothetical protein